jgi:hypothetical protein
LYCSGSMCVGVTVWFGWGGVVSLCRLKHCFILHKVTTPPQPNHTVTPTHIEPEQYNPCNKSIIIRKLLKMDVLTFETCWAVNSEIIKEVISSWSLFIQIRYVFCAFIIPLFCVVLETWCKRSYHLLSHKVWELYITDFLCRASDFRSLRCSCYWWKKIGYAE